MRTPDGFERHPLGDGAHVWCGMIPPDLTADPDAFDRLWALHPAEHSVIHLHGRDVKLPRWQQAYEADYRFSGQVSKALPVPADFAPYLEWCRRAVDPRMNGLLLNWYDGAQGHYIGKHRDSCVGRQVGSDIVTISLGETRVFRMRRYKGEARVDLSVPDGAVIIIPWATNQAWTHEVPRLARFTGRRISITVRAFLPEASGTAR